MLRRSAFVATLAMLAAAATARSRLSDIRALETLGMKGASGQRLPHKPTDLPWRLLVEQIFEGAPNARLGLVQAQHIFGRVARSERFLRAGLFRVRIPASLARQGEDGWHHDRFPDGWWMEIMHRLGVPFKVVVELWPRFTDEMHAAHTARVVRRTRPEVVIIGNELNVVDRRPGVDTDAEIERYLDRYEVMHAAVKTEAPETKVQLYGEAYYGEPDDEEAFLRQVLTAMRRRALPPPDIAGIHVYDHAEVIPDRVAGYRSLLADFGLHIPLSIEEVGPRSGVVDGSYAPRLAGEPADDADQYPNRLAELRAGGWLSEAEQSELVAQHLAMAAATADQAQVFCAIDFDAEINWRRGLVSNVYGRTRPAFDSFTFLQRLLNDLESVSLRRGIDNGGANTVTLRRRDGIAASIHWTSPRPEFPAVEAAPLRVRVPPYTFVCDARGQLLSAPRAEAYDLPLPAATAADAGGAVRILI
jgi:hypothetical protein